MDRPWLVALSVSMAFHALFLSVQLIRLSRHVFQHEQKPLDVVYESRGSEWEPLPVQRQMAALAEGRHGLSGGLQAPMSQIRIPERTLASVPSMLPDAQAGRSAVVDLTNLVEAAQGDPVLLSYFSAIREQIQRTADRQAWLGGQSTEGLIYVSFALASTGQVSSPDVLSDRSAPSKFLQDVAVKIVKSSSPFPPFPPSLSESSRTIVVPLEFLLGPSNKTEERRN